jgi:ATP-dependent DNA helicase RecQ
MPVGTAPCGSEAAGPLLRGETHVQLRRTTAPPRRRRRTGGEGDATPPATTLTGADEVLFEVLRTERRSIADEQGVPAYVVLHDATLREIAARRPRTSEDLLDVPGIGTAKAERYGERILAAVGRAGDA